ncbi:MAG: phage tail protein I [Rhodospirillaceae bacterium]
MVSLMPPNASALETALANSFDRISDVPIPVRDLWSPSTCAEALLPWLAWALSVDVWRDDWPSDIKRQVIAYSYLVHLRKGTTRSIQDALAAIGLSETRIDEWQAFGGAPYSIRVETDITDRGLTEEEAAAASDVIANTKPARTTLDRVTIALGTKAPAPIGGMALLAGETIQLLPHSITERETDGPIPVCAAGIYGVETLSIYPEAA